jgi:hypothetical protein
MENELRNSKKTASLIIMTDGESTDGDIIDYLKLLGNVWVYVFMYVYICIHIYDVLSTITCLYMVINKFVPI